MFTAKIVAKELVGATLRISVEFSDGVTTVMEQCIPQNEDGLKYWVKSRLETFNSTPILDAKYVENTTVDVSEPVVVVPEPTAEELARNNWLALYRKWTKVKTTLIDTGILTGTETPLVNMKNKVKADFLPAYLDFI